MEDVVGGELPSLGGVSRSPSRTPAVSAGPSAMTSRTSRPVAGEPDAAAQGRATRRRRKGHAEASRVRRRLRGRRSGAAASCRRVPTGRRRRRHGGCRCRPAGRRRRPPAHPTPRGRGAVCSGPADPPAPGASERAPDRAHQAEAHRGRPDRRYGRDGRAHVDPLVRPARPAGSGQRLAGIGSRSGARRGRRRRRPGGDGAGARPGAVTVVPCGPAGCGRS